MHALPTEYYTSASIYTREQERIFSRLWLFAGLKMMVSKAGAYYARELAGVPIVLQNLSGELACFLNVCAHRNAQVQPNGFGQRGLVCGYHGFRYAIDGRVAQIPLADQYQYSEAQRDCLRLKRFALREVGEFLFVSFADRPIALEQQFSEPLLDSLRGISGWFDRDLIYATSTHRYNWKLPAENLRDLLHPRFVHPQTLAPLFDFECSLTDERPAATLRDLSFGGPEGVAKKDLSWPWWSQVDRWPDADERYYNWLLYPNLHIASPDGCRSFGIEQYDPLAPNATRLVHFMLTARRRQAIPYGDALLRGALRGARVVLDEDARVMEGVQCGLSARGPAMQLGRYERQLGGFGQVTRELLDD